MMLHYVIVQTVVLVGHIGMCARQATLERQDSTRTYLAHHELESVFITVITIMIIITSVVTQACECTVLSSSLHDVLVWQSD